jgi:hypothetical protein
MMDPDSRAREAWAVEPRVEPAAKVCRWGWVDGGEVYVRGGGLGREVCE